MRQMEQDLGLGDLSAAEKNVLYAFHSAVQDDKAETSTDAVKNQATTAGMAHATFHRALNRLLELGYIEHAENSRTKIYKIVKAG